MQDSAFGSQMAGRLQASERDVLDKIDADELVSLAADLAKIPSPRGFEGHIGDFVYEWMKSNGIKCFKEEASQGRYNIVGLLEGSVGKPRLTFNGHMDTSFGLPEDFWINGPGERFDEEGVIHDDVVLGRSVVNDKGPVAAFLTAGKAIARSQIRLRGDIVLACVVGEIGQAPVDEFQGSRYEGKGFGTRRLLAKGWAGDYALVAERTNFGVSRGETGVAWFKVTIHGKPGGVYAPMIQRPYSSFEENPNAIVLATTVVRAVEDWALEYEKRHTREFEDGTFTPKVNIGAIRGGLPVRISAAPSICAIYIEVRLLPDQDPESVRQELREILAGCGVRFDLEQYLFRRGYVAKGADRLVEAVASAQRAVLHTAPGKVLPAFCSMWRDLNVYNEAGVPAITYGPPSVSADSVALAGQKAPGLRKEDLLAASKIYALTALRLCA